MRDGVHLAADIWLPSKTPAPALLVRIPYNKSGFQEMAMVPTKAEIADAGYVLIWQDVRGRYRSEGENFEPFVAEAQDGEDTIAWIREREWSDGRVGMFGASYMGCVQWLAASTAPKGLLAIAPHLASSDLYRAPWYSQGGAMSWHTVHLWSLANAKTDPNISMQVMMQQQQEAAQLLDKLPMSDRETLRKHAAWWKSWMSHTSRDSMWQKLAVAEHPEVINTPALNVGGWFDLFLHETVRAFRVMRSSARSETARRGQYLFIGPWDHFARTGKYPDLEFGPDAPETGSGIHQLHMEFFDRYVRGNETALDRRLPVHIFVMGTNVWRSEFDWPLPDTEYTDFYLDSGGHAATRSGDGLLRAGLPQNSVADKYTFDPADPTPSVGGRLLTMYPRECGPRDQSSVEDRPDVLCFTTPPLETPVEVTGHISLILYITSSAIDTDFTGKLVDVHPDSRATYLTDGILRARYRNSLATPEMLEPGKVYKLRLDLSATSNVFLAGHRIRLEVSSSNYPRYDRNSNTGGDIVNETEFAVAENQVLHGPEHPSKLVLPVIRR